MIASDLPRRPRETIPVVVDGPFVAASFPWQLLPPQDARVIVVKSTLAIVPDGAATPIAEQASLLGDVHFDGDPAASLSYASDFAPFKPRADVLLVGHAYPPGQAGWPARPAGPGARLTSVQLAFGDLRRALAAVGDRQWQAGSPTAPAAFTRIPLRYERAYGGPGYDANPLGIGYLAGAPPVRLPNLERPEGMIRSTLERPAPVCFGPVSSTTRARADRLGTYDQAWLRERWPYFPRDFDWGYFNAAPAEQQIPYPRGDERFSLAGVHPELNVVNGRLPGVAPRVLAALSPGAGALDVALREVLLHLDTVWFDADAMRVALVWRGIMDVSAEHAPEIAALFVGEDRSAAGGTERLERRFTARVAELRGDPRTPGAPAAPASRPEEPFVAGEVRVPPVLSRAVVEERLASGASLRGADFSGCDLSDVDLCGRDLGGAIFTGARLDGARLDGADLSGAVLVRVTGYRPSFKQAILRGANLTEAALIEAELSGAALDGATLADASLSGARLRGASLAHANAGDARLDGAVFDEASAAGADFSGAALGGASFRGAVLEDAQIYGCAAEGACFDGAKMARFRADGARLTWASFVQAVARESSFESADLRRATFTDADLDGAVLAGANLERATLTRVTAKGARFRGAILAGVSALKANLMEASFEGADLTAADLRHANLYAVETWKAKLDGIRLDEAILAGSKLAR